jgi:shikimate kinase
VKARYGMEIPEIFRRHSESYFRELESQAISELAKMSGVIIATGGGAVLKPENIKELRKNGRLYFIDRPISALIPTDDRPLSSTKEAITQRYNERYPIYLSACDYRIDADCDKEEVLGRILEGFRENA